MKIEHIEQFIFKHTNGFSGVCDLQIHSHHHKIVALVTELVGQDERGRNTGVSITNAAESIATLIRCDIGVLWDYYVEYIPSRGSDLSGLYRWSETFDLCAFTWCNERNRYTEPRWTPFSRLEAERLIGATIPERK